MSTMFMKSPAPKMVKTAPVAVAAQALSLQELDRELHCPEGVEMDSWKHLCQLRRKKISAEEEIANVVAELAETEDVGISEISVSYYPD